MQRLQRVATHLRDGGGAPATASAPASSPYEGLAQLGFRPGSPLVLPSHVAELRDEGYTVLRGVIGEPWLHRLRERYEEIVVAEREGGLGGAGGSPG